MPTAIQLTSDSGTDSRITEIRELFQQLGWRSRHHLARRLEDFGLTVPQYFALAEIARNGSRMTMSEISNSLQLPKSSLTSIADRLDAMELIERGTLDSDRRAVVVGVTAKGRELVHAIDVIRAADLASLLDGLSEGDLSQFSHVLTTMVNHLIEETVPVTDSEGT